MMLFTQDHTKHHFDYIGQGCQYVYCCLLFAHYICITLNGIWQI